MNTLGSFDSAVGLQLNSDVSVSTLRSDCASSVSRFGERTLKWPNYATNSPSKANLSSRSLLFFTTGLNEWV